ncbi:hypothetical protein KY289_001459 [Solanum tuberosum]|nr:hypothetical protein KY289_001459 [Solanum tuberosum]
MGFVARTLKICHKIRVNSFKRYATDLEAFGGSKDGPKLLQAILNTIFKGLSGNFQIVDGHCNLHLIRSSMLLENFGSIIWPGDTTSVPNGWVIPINGKKLRIGVPVKDNFTEFVEVTRVLSL